MTITPTQVKQFQAFIWHFYCLYKRPMPWRETTDPYEIFISEVMLQQTQVTTVMNKYGQFLEKFPTMKSLATANFADVLLTWKGLGYNSRAKRLIECGRMVMDVYGGVIPNDPIQLIKLPGVGPATVGSLSAFIFNQPVVFIETNIRRVMLYHFFFSRDKVPDSQILPLVEQTLDRDNPREWYFALMDYGSYLAKVIPNPNKSSRHYVKQSVFEGSSRQLRSEILHLLSVRHEILTGDLKRKLNGNMEFFERALKELEKEGFVLVNDGEVKLR